MERDPKSSKEVIAEVRRKKNMAKKKREGNSSGRVARQGQLGGGTGTWVNWKEKENDMVLTGEGRGGESGGDAWM